MKKAVVCLVVLVSTAYLYCRAQDRQVDGFYIDRITTCFKDDPQWDISPTPEQIERARSVLQQPFYYLAHGFQCFAFVSQDGRYVLKFIRHQRLRPLFPVEWIPDISFLKQFKESKIQQGKKRADYLFRSLKVSFVDVAYETGLLMVHLNKTKNHYPQVTLVDKAGTEHVIAIDNFEFVLQEKAVHIKPLLANLMQEQKLDEAQRRIDQIFSLLATCAKKGIADNDSQLIRKNNLGFLQDRAIYIDTGKLTRKESIKTRSRFEEDLERLTPLHDWLMAEYPELATYFEEQKMRTLRGFA